MNKMIGKRSFTFMGKVIEPGDDFEADDIAAALLNVRGKARYDGDEECFKPIKRSTYKHRMMTAENSLNAFHPDNQRKKRKYTRRMKAEQKGQDFE